MRTVNVLSLAVLAWFGPGLARAQEKPRYDVSEAAMGASLYKSYCAVCHGSSGKGDGPMADQLRFRPSDLTAIAKRSGGKYPFEQVHKIIDGRIQVKGHGGPDMPVWGDAFKNAYDGYDEKKVQEKINRLNNHLASLQVEVTK